MTAARDAPPGGDGAVGMELVPSAAPASGLALATGGAGAGTRAAPPATQTAPIGVIVPPPDIRSIVDKTAQFVARNGPEFEKRILANERNNVKFNFLVAGDPYNAYYQHKVAAFKADDSGVAKLPAEPTNPSSAAEPGLPEKVAVQLATNFKPVVLEAPEKEQYTVATPDDIAAFDLDVIKLTAQFVARNGKSFLTGLTSREHTNPQFNFLKPTHSMFTFFTALADAYSKVLMPPKQMAQRLQRDAEDKTAVLDRCLKRLEWERSQERARQEAEDKAEAERDAMAAIDWHDFVVVETIDFYNEEDASLPLPLTLADVVAQLRTAPAESVMPVEAQEAEMDVEMDEEERTLVAAAGAGVLPPQAATVHAPEPQMKIVRNYKRADGAGAGAGAAGPDSLKFVVSPITGELVPVDQMAEHMRISLIDPKWKEQKEIMMGKLRGSTVASDEEIAKNVIRLARTRPDIFGSTDEEVSTAVTAELESRKTAAAAPQPGLASHAVVQPGMRAVASMEGQPAGAARSGMQMPAPPGLQMPPAAGLPRPPAAVPPRPYGVSPYPPPMGMPMAPPGFTGAGALLPGPQPGMLGRPGAPLPPPGYAPPMPPYGMSAHGLPMPPLLPTDEPDAKRPRTEEAVIPEEDFAEAHPDPVTIAITVPDVDGEANLNGQTVSLEVASVMETVGDVKARLAAAIGVPASKQKLSSQTLGFLKDTSTLAAYNFGNGTVMIMGLKERGGRTKK